MIRTGDCCFAEDPYRLSGKARLFWHPKLDPYVIDAEAVRTTRDDPDAFDLFAQPLSATLLVGGCEGEQLVLGSGQRQARLTISSGSLLSGPVRLKFRVSGGNKLEMRLLALHRFSKLVRGGPLPSKLYRPIIRADRWNLLVRTLDALAHSSSQRGVAIQLFGEQHVAEKWDGPSDFLRARVRRLIGRARQLADGAYLDLFER